MKNTHCKPNFLCGDAVFTHQEVIDLKDRFLTTGFHYIKALTPQAGRMIMTTFLASLPCFNDIAVLTHDETELPATYTDLYTTLLFAQITTQETLAYFFAEQFNY